LSATYKLCLDTASLPAGARGIVVVAVPGHFLVLEVSPYHPAKDLFFHVA
jgi:hypothetical protein